jgi:hypothetical protein
MSTYRASWKSSKLEGEFSRRIIGFDIRRNAENLFMTSYDENARHEDINNQYFDKMSAMNIFNCNPNNFPGIIIPDEARILAFDMPSEFVEILCAGKLSNPGVLPQIDISIGWNFLGFDVVDPFTQTSAIHGFDGFWLKFNCDKNYKINKNGLISNDEDSVKICTDFDILIKEHAPFVPCGIWINQ